MKKLSLFIFLAFATSAFAQNFQVHYDFGQGRKYVTTTFEMFKPDKWGNTFMFIDFDYRLDKEKQPALAYMEIARCISIGKTPFSAQVEYNGGFFINGSKSGSPAFPINNAFLTGVDYGWHNADYSKTFNLKLLYKYITVKNPASFQITGAWNLNFLNRKITLSGFADFWREDNINFTNYKGEPLSQPEKSRFTFVSEPQFWYNFTPNLSLGSEIEIGVNFSAVKGIKICPTLGAKWTF